MMKEKVKVILMGLCLLILPLVMYTIIGVEYCDGIENALEMSSGVEDCSVYVDGEDKSVGYLVVGSRYDSLLEDIDGYSYRLSGGSVIYKDSGCEFITEKGVGDLRYNGNIRYSLGSCNGRNYFKLSTQENDRIGVSDVSMVEDIISEILKHYK